MGHAARRENITTATTTKDGKDAVVPARRPSAGIRTMPVAAGRALPNGAASADATSNGNRQVQDAVCRVPGSFSRDPANRHRPVCTFPFRLK